METYADARKCAALFREHAQRIDGILIALPNSGDERAIVDTLRESGLVVPLLVQAEPDDLDRMDVARRRDSYCGKIGLTGSGSTRSQIDGAENAVGAWVVAPNVEKTETVHVILKVTDKGSPPLSRYKRVVVTIVP